MIARIWKGVTKAEDAETYSDYVRDTGIGGLRSTRGNVAAIQLRRIVGGNAEFTVISFWESQEAIEAFAGEETSRPVYYPDDDRYLLELHGNVDHFEVIDFER